MPSTVFFDFDDGSTQVGEAAYERYYEGDRGRFLRSFKSALGTSTIDHEIRIKQNTYLIKDVIQNYLREVLGRTQATLSTELNSLVVGRPVSFVDDNPEADRKAEAQLKDVVQGLGIEHVEFQLEPIAAALNYGVTVTGEEVVLVIDIGAGTSDFSVVKFSDNMAAKVISNCGIHIGGNDFDKVIALNNVMPNFGYQQRFKHRPDLEAPKSYFLNASSWHQIDLLYDRKVLNSLREIAPQMQQPSAIHQLVEVIESRQVHTLLGVVEKVKKQFSEHDKALIDLAFLGHGLQIQLPQDLFESQIDGMCVDIIKTANKAISDAGLRKADIDTVYVTGGSMGLRHLHKKVVNEYLDSTVVEGDRSTAVARGLALDASEKFS